MLEQGKSKDWTEDELKRLQLVLMKNQVNQGVQAEVVKSTVETISDIDGFKYSKEDICRICNVSARTFDNFIALQPVAKRDSMSIGSSHKKFYNENVLKQFQLWLMNNHKIQGDTIKNKDLYITIDDCLTNPKNIQTLLRHLYVAISRAQHSKQIHFDSTINNIKCLSGKPLDNPNQIKCPIFDTNSAYLSSLSIDEIFDLFSKNILKKVTDFVPYIDNNMLLFSNKNNYISGIDNNKINNIPVQNLLTEVTLK